MPLRENHTLDNMLVVEPDRRASVRDACPNDMLKRVALLPEPDRQLMELAVKNQLSHRQLARIVHQPSGTVTRRLRRLSNRLLNPLVVALTEPALPLQHEYRQLGIEHFLQGRTIRELAEVHRMKESHIRRILAYVRGWHHGLTTRWRRRR